MGTEALLPDGSTVLIGHIGPDDDGPIIGLIDLRLDHIDHDQPNPDEDQVVPNSKA